MCIRDRDITRHFIELRGIGIIDVKTLFGVESVKDTQAIDMVIKLEEWDREKEYDRLGMEDQYTEFLGNKVVCHSIPIRPGKMCIRDSFAAGFVIKDTFAGHIDTHVRRGFVRVFSENPFENGA